MTNIFIFFQYAIRVFGSTDLSEDQWRQCEDQIKVKTFFEVVALPFPCNGHLLCCVNIPTVLLMFFYKFASSIPYFSLFLYFIVDGLALALNNLGLFTYIVSQIVFDF